MNKLQTDGHDAHAAPGSGAPAPALQQRERISALMDGQLAGAELAAALEFATQDAAGRAHWSVCHLIGDVLRSPDLARPENPEFILRLRQRIAQEAPAARARPAPALQTLAPAQGLAANAALFRWKLLAGCACLAATAAIGWSALAHLQAENGGAQLAAAPATSAAAPAPLLAQNQGLGQSAPPGAPAQGQAPEQQLAQQMIRDPRLDELLAAHKQFGSMSALQMPAGFLRNATFEAPER